MAVTFVIGRAGTGKTHLCLEAVAAALSEPDVGGRLIVLVPEQASSQMERALVRRVASGGYWRAEVLSFTRLARRLFGEGGGEPVMLRPQARALALRRVTRDMRLPRTVFGRAATTHGFFMQLDRLVEELLTERVTPADLSAAAAGISDETTRGKVSAVAHIYGRYLEWLGEDRLDSALHLQALRDRIASVPWLREASVWVDGFAGFTGQEFATLSALARNVKDMTVTLLMDPSSPAVTQASAADSLALFERTRRTYRRLRAELEQAGVEMRDPVLLRPNPIPRFQTAPTLAMLERGLAAPHEAGAENTTASEQAPEVRVIECGTHRDELHEAARALRRMMVESGGELRFRDFAVIARDLDPFAELVSEVFEEYEIPFFLDRRRGMSAHPLARMLEALLDAASDDYSCRSMARLLRTGLTPLSRAQAETLEHMIIRQQLRGASQWGRKVWDPKAELWESIERPPTGELSPSPLDQRRLDIYRAIEPLARCAALDADPTGSQWAVRLHDALEALGARRVIEEWIARDECEKAWESAETHRLAWEELCGVLENLHEVLDDTPLAINELRHIIGSALAELTVGLAPPALDQVLVSSIERSRHPEIRHAWVFAFNEGVFPAQPAEDQILSTADRRQVAEAGLPAPAVHRDDAFGERLLAYIAFSRPSDGLTISYATVDD
ncbi:MAG: exodeoxyribonuclease V subunit gamma, partial [Planctomycetes bacterium]|nr:exodeoxyribonuclease V subunit gamma [Planctomycetota bacterium]